MQPEELHDAVQWGARHLYADGRPSNEVLVRASALSNCKRSLGLQLRGAIGLPKSAKSALTLEHGTLRGLELAKALERACGDDGPLSDYRVQLEPEFSYRLPLGSVTDADVAQRVSMATGLTYHQRGADVFNFMVLGHVDALLWGRTDNSVRVIDFKTAHPFSFKEASKGNKSEGYLAQLGFYQLAMSSSAQVKGLVEPMNPWLFWENKGDHEFFAEELNAEQCIAAATNALDDVVNEIEMWLEGLEPTYQPFGPNLKGLLPWQCRYCPVYGACWGDNIVAITGDADLPSAIQVK